jgi:hypothetical protein
VFILKKMVALLGSLLWTYLELWMALAVVAIAVQIYFPRNDAARVYVPKRFRNQSETNRRMLQLLRSWVKRLDQRVSSIRLRRTMRRKHERCLRIALGHGSQRTSRKRSRRLLALLAYSAVCHSTEACYTQSTEAGYFDTDSKPVGIDNRCSACISHDVTDFIGELRPSNRWIKGFGGSRTTNIQTGTLQWLLEDDDGKVHTFRIPNSYYVEQGGVRLLSPQHWAKAQSDTKRRGTGSETTSKQVELFWGGRKFKKTVPMDASNVATLRLAPGYTRFGAFCAEAEVDSEEEDAHPMCFDANVVSDNEDDGEEDDLHD